MTDADNIIGADNWQRVYSELYLCGQCTKLLFNSILSSIANDLGCDITEEQARHLINLSKISASNAFCFSFEYID